MDALWQDIRYALRALRKAPVVAGLVVVSLGLAIAGNTAVFSLVNGILFRPMPYQEPERLALVGEYQDPALAGQVNSASALNFLDWEERQEAFSEMAAYTASRANLGTGERGDPVTVASVTPDFFPVLGVEPARGRGFLPREGGSAAEPVLVLTHAFWQNRFGGSPEVLGETLVVDGERHTVVGVLAEDFEFLDPEVRLYRPLALDPADLDREQRFALVLGRLAPGVSTSEADAAMAAVGERLAAEYPEANRGYTTDVVNLREEVPSSQDRQLLALLQGAMVFVLLIACANVANLLLARTQGRVTEIAVRSSLGAGRGRIVRQLVTESLVLAAAGGLLGLGGGILGTRLMAEAFAARLPRFLMPAVDARVLLFTVGLSVLGGLLVGLLPAIQTSRMNVQSALKEGGRGASLGGRRRLVSKALVVAEIALALVLLAGAGVLIRTFLDIQGSDPGFETAGLLTAGVGMPETGFGEESRRLGAAEEVLRRVEALPGVTAAAASTFRPRTPLAPAEPFTVDAAPPAEGQAPPTALAMAVSPGFFDTVGMAVVEGRGPERSDRPETSRVAVVNRRLAERYWSDDSPVGRRITVRGESRRVVGVVENVTHDVFFNRGGRPVIYLPLAQGVPAGGLTITARTGGDPAGLGNALRDAVLAADPKLVVSQVLPLDDYVAQFFVGMQVVSTILVAFGGLALLLAALGTYGVLAYSVAQRTHEIGVRMAMGARGRQVMGMVTRQGLTLAGIGIAIGVPGVILVTRAVAAALEGFAEIEPLTVVAVAAVLALITALASWMPARRAAAVDPLVALRGE